MSYFEKSVIRSKFIELRNGLSSGEVEDLSSEIGEIFLNFSKFKQNKNILFYASFGNEVKTFDLINKSLKNNKRVFLPIADTLTNELIVKEINNTGKDLETGRWGIPIPKNRCKNLEKTDEIDMVIVPGIVFDSDGGRIGFGKGYYDRFLSNISSDVLTAGICFDFQVSNERLPLASHDIKIKTIITEKRIINCEQRNN